MLSFYLAALESGGDRKMFAEIYQRHHIKMERAAIKILRDQSAAEDAVQNAFMQVIRHFEKIYEIPCEELPFWLISIVKNEALMLLRKRDRTVTLEEGRFPEGELTMLDEVEDYKGKNVAFFKKTSTFFFPEKEMSDEQLLQIIDFYAKRDYSLQKMNEMIADKETDFPEEARPAVPQNPTDSAVLESSAAFQPDQALTIPYTGDLSIRAIAAGGDGILLAGRNVIHRMEIGSSDSVLFYDGFDENTQITELCEDGEGNVYAGLLKVTADGNYEVHLAGRGELLGEDDHE